MRQINKGKRKWVSDEECKCDHDFTCGACLRASVLIAPAAHSQGRRTEVVKTGPADRPWCLRWQTPAMPAPAFEYFATEAEAREAERKMNRA